MRKPMPSDSHHHHPDPSTPTGQIQQALFRVLKSLVFRSEPESPLNELPISQLKCLHIVRENEGQKMVDVSHKMEVKLPALSQIVNRLVKRGMLVRQPDPSDRRVVRLGLTEQARAIIAEADGKRQARMAATAANLDDKAARAVTEGLTLLAVAAEKVETEEREAAPFSPDPDALAEIITERSRVGRTNSSAGVSPGRPTGRQ